VLCVADSVNPSMQQVQQEQSQDPTMGKLIEFLRDGVLIENLREAQRVLGQGKKGYYAVDNILYYEGTDMPGRRHLVVPNHLKEKFIEEDHTHVLLGILLLRKYRG